MKWTDSYRIAADLYDSHPEVDPRMLRFIELRNMVLDLPSFDDVPQHCGEKALEAIQQAWIEELE